MITEGLIIGSDKKSRCWWCGNDPLYMDYHDKEWGKPVTNDIRLFEKICLEGFQAGLSWITILRKRETFRAAFGGFDFNKVALYTEQDITRLLKNAGIVRHRGKIEATINNAQCALELIAEFGSLSKYFWQFKPKPETRPKKMDHATLSQITMSNESKALTKDLKKRGWKFVGPTTCYAFMQAMGMVNDHIDGCDYR
jgi:DNA-3-methyladenine glycosylase I